MKQWYQKMATAQKAFLYILSIVLPVVIVGSLGPSSLPVAPVLFVPLFVLVYLQLGVSREN